MKTVLLLKYKINIQEKSFSNNYCLLFYKHKFNQNITNQYYINYKKIILIVNQQQKPILQIINLMSIQKHLNTLSNLKSIINDNPILHYRVRNLSRNQSMKLLQNKPSSKLNILSKINNKYTLETSFFAKQNINELQVQSQKDLPKYRIDKGKQKEIKRNTSHRILRKVTSQPTLIQSKQIISVVPSIQSIPQTAVHPKDNYLQIHSNQKRKFSLQKKVQFIKKKHNQDKTFFSKNKIGNKTFVQHKFNPTQIQSEQLLGQKKKQKSKLKLLVRNPFKSINSQKKKNDFMLESQSIIEDRNNFSMISQQNKKQFEQFISCID